MNLKLINDRTLIQKIEDLVHKERELLIEILHHLREIDRRRFYSELGCKSLFDFTFNLSFDRKEKRNKKKCLLRKNFPS